MIHRLFNNPYKLIIINGDYYVIFKDSKNVENYVKVDKVIYNEFNNFKLEEISQRHKYERHIEQSEMIEETLYRRLRYKPRSVEEIVFNKIMCEQLYKFIECLSVTQKKRLIMYYFYEMSLREIAEIERCSVHSVYASIISARQKLTLNFKEDVKTI